MLLFVLLIFVAASSAESDNFIKLHPLQENSTDCLRSQYFLNTTDKDIRVSYTWRVAYATLCNLMKIVYDGVALPNTILLDWIIQKDKIFEFNIIDANFMNSTFNLGDVAFYNSLKTLQITNSGLKHVVNLKKHCNTSLFYSLDTINITFNKISYINGKIFENMPVLKCLDLMGNHLEVIEHVEKIVSKSNFFKLLFGNINYIKCTSLESIYYNLDLFDRYSIFMTCDSNLPIKCKRIAKLTCPFSRQKIIPLPLLAQYFNNSSPFTNVSCSSDILPHISSSVKISFFNFIVFSMCLNVIHLRRIC